MSKIIALMALLLILAELSGCGVVFWRLVYSSKQPGGNARVQIDEKCGLADCSVKVIIIKGSRSKQIEYRRGCNINFAQAAWVGGRVGVFVDGGTCQEMKIAYDTVLNLPVPFSAIKEALEKAIVTGYGVNPDELKAVDGNVFAWATGEGNQHRGWEEFRRRYPH